MKKTFASVLSFSILSALFLPVFVSAQVGVPCGDFASGQKECGFNDLIILANNIIKFLMFSVAVPLAAIGIMWVGGNLVINQDKEGAWSKAKDSFWDIILGFGIMLASYVLIKTVLFAFISDEQARFMQFIFQ